MRNFARSTALVLLLSPAAAFAEESVPSAPTPATHLEKATDAMKKAGSFGKAAPAAPTENRAPTSTEKAPAPTTGEAAMPPTAPEKAGQAAADEKTAAPSMEKPGAVAGAQDAAATTKSIEKPATAPVGAGQPGSTIDDAKSAMMEKATKKAGGSMMEKMPTPPASPGNTR